MPVTNTATDRHEALPMTAEVAAALTWQVLAGAAVAVVVLLVVAEM